MAEMKDRIRQIMEAQHMSQQTFANFIGINAASLSSIFNNRTKPTLNTVEAIKNKIPNLNTDWLMFGRGAMFDNPQDDVIGNHEKDVDLSDNQQSSLAGEFVPDLFSRDDASQYATQHDKGLTMKPEIRYIERPQRQITEIRVYFDDLTYESFVPKK